MASEKHQQMIDKIMDNFNFANVAAVMEFRRWAWADNYGDMVIPDEPGIREQARLLLKTAINDGVGKEGENCCATGGLVALFRDGPNGYLRLAFELEGYEANANEYK